MPADTPVPEPKAAVSQGVSMKWGEIHDLPVLIADTLHWRTLTDRCYLTFGQMSLPLLDGPLPDNFEIDVQPVARLVVTPEILRVWSQMLHQAVAQFEKPGDK